MQWLAEICVRRPIFASVLTLLIVVLGLAGYSSLGVDRFPQIDFPIITVTTVLPGASPEDIESEVTDRIEGAINTIGSIDELRSISTEGVSMVVVVFKLEKDIDIAAQDVRDRIERIRNELPRDVLAPVISKVDPDASPIAYLALKAPGRDLTWITERADTTVRRNLEVLPGVGQVRILGSQKRTIHVWLDPIKLQSFGMQPAEVARALATQNVTIPGGRVDTSRDQLSLRVYGRVEDPLELAKVPVRLMGERVVRIEDVARVEDGAEEADSIALWNGEPAVVMSVRKQSGANTIAVADKLQASMEEIQALLPPDATLELIRDESSSIRTGTDAVKEHLLIGAILAALVVLLFLGSGRSTIIAALAIPTSVIGTFAVMAALGYTLNTITLLALALCVGIVIDDAIVVLENIYRFVEEKGMSPKDAAVEGTREIGLAVMATTLSLIAVFMPVAFIAGIPGRFLRGFGVTMSVSIAVSLFVSFTLTPMLASRWLKAKIPGQHRKSGLERLADMFYQPIENIYMWMLGWAMRWRWVVVVLSLASLAMVPVLGGMVKKGFLPNDDRAQFEVVVRAPEGASVARTGVIGERFARDIRGLSHVEYTLTTVGGDEQGEDNVARIYVRLTDPKVRATTQDEMMERVRNEVLSKATPDLRVSVSQVSDIGGTGQSTARIQYNLVGPDLDQLGQYADETVKQLKRVEGAVDVDSSLVLGKPELGVFVDRARAADMGVSVADIATTLQFLVGGQKVGNFSQAGEQYEVRMRADAPWRSNPDMLGVLMIPSTKLGMVPLTEVVQLRAGEGPAVINRLNRQRAVTIMANASGVGDNVVGDALKAIVKKQNLPAGYELRATGQAKLMAETAVSVLFGFGMAFVFMYLILAAQFESWLHPFTILVSLPLTLPFALLSLLLTGQSLDMFSVLGIFVLFGIVKKNSILQVDHTNQLRERGMARLPAIMQANKDRLRPILMTTVAFVAGMIPLATSSGIGSGFNRATAGVVVGGQVLSLLLTLLATPVTYSIFDDILEFLKKILIRLGIMSPAEEL